MFTRQSVIKNITGTAVWILLSLLVPAMALALAGVHSFAVSTWDTTRSTVVLSYHHGFLLEGGTTNFAGYNANFSSTSGRLSAQFGLNYVGYRPDDIRFSLNGISGSAVAVYGIPVGKRYKNGVPKVSFDFFAGSTPTALFSGEYNYVSIPLNMGFGIEINPVKFLSIVPWFELAPSFNLDTVINYDNMQKYIEGLTEDDINVVYRPDGTIESVTVKDGTVDKMISESVDLDFSFDLRMRGGLQMVFNLGDRVDLQIDGAVAQVGHNFYSKPTIFAGGALVFAWDDAPIGILPKEEQLKNIPCNSIMYRARQCPAYRNMQKDIKDETLEQCTGNTDAEKEQAEPAAPPATTEPLAEKPGKPLSPKGVGTTNIPQAKPAQPEPAPVKPLSRPISPAPLSPPSPASPPSLNEPLSK
jgi:hypothetical protein